MRPRPLPLKTTLGERVAKYIRRAGRRHFSAEDKVRIVLDGLRGEDLQVLRPRRQQRRFQRGDIVR